MAQGIEITWAAVCLLMHRSSIYQIQHVDGEVYTLGWHLPPRGWSSSLHSASQALSHPDIPFPWGKLSGFSPKPGFSLSASVE